MHRTRRATKKHKRYNHSDQIRTDPFPLASNRYDSLYSHPESDDTPFCTQKSRVVKPYHAGKHKMDPKKRVPQKRQHKIMILGDSHAKGCAAELNHLLKNDFEVLGSVNPGSELKHIKDSNMVKLQQLLKEDDVVLWGGSNDISKNISSVGMKHLLELVMKASHTNVILISAPHRYDLMSNSCVPKEIEMFNRKLRTSLEKLVNVEMIEVVNDRNLYTRHRQHLNSKGKECMARLIASTIKTKPMNVKWYTDSETVTLDHQLVQSKVVYNQEEESNEHSNLPGISLTAETGGLKYPHQATQKKTSFDNTTLNGVNIIKQIDTVTESARSSNHARKIPAARSNDFLWVT